MKIVKIKSDCGRVFSINAMEVAKDRATYYSQRDSDTSYEEELVYTHSEDSELTEWLFNNMNWWTLKSLKELDRVSIDLSDLDVQAEVVKK